MQWSGLIYRYPLTADQLEIHLKRAVEDPKRHKMWNAMVGGMIVGHLELSNIWWEYDRKATLCGVILAPEARGRNLGSRMVREVLRFGFEDLQLHRIELLSGFQPSPLQLEVCTHQGVRVSSRILRDQIF